MNRKEATKFMHATREDARGSKRALYLMKIAGLTLVGILALIGLFSTALFALAHLENPGSSFMTYKELEESGLIDRGWVSKYLPRSATEIEESHDIDTNRSWTSFKFAPGDTSVAASNCRLLHKTDKGEKFLCPPYEQTTSILVLRVDGTGNHEQHSNEI